MNREQKANRTSTPNTGLAATLSNLFRVQGTSAPSSTPSARGPVRPHTKFLALLAISLVALFSFASSASADSSEMGTITEASYDSAHVTGKVTTKGFVPSYSFEYSTSESGPWQDGLSESLPFGDHTNEPVEGTISVPKGGTKYFVRLSAHSLGQTEGVSPKTAPYPSFTTLTPDPTTVLSIDNASQVEYTLAEAKGEIDRPVKSNDVTCNFEYIGDDQYGANPVDDRFAGATPVPCDTGNPAETPGTVKATGHVPVSAKFAGLSPSTTYHLRLTASNSGSSDSKEAASTFTTLGPVPKPTVLVTDNATEVEYTVAKVSGKVSRPAGADPALDVTCNFEYITDDQFNANEGIGDPGFTGATPVACEPEGNPAENPILTEGETTVKATLAGLSASTKYHLRLSAANQGGSDAKDAATTFTTAGPIPKPVVLATDNATELAKRSAKATGKVERPAGADPALDVSCRFEYVTQSEWEANSNAFPDGAPSAPCVENPITSPAPDHLAVSAEVSAELGGLEPGTTYHLRLVAENGGGADTEEAAATFTTTAIIPPTFTVDSITEVSYTGFRVTGTADPGNQGVFPFFEYAPVGTDDWHGTLVGHLSALQPETAAQQFSLDFPCDPKQYWGGCAGPLKPGTTYRVRVGGQNLEDSAQSYSDLPYPEFTTKGTSTPPSGTLSISDVTATTAHFSGTVDTHAPAGSLPDDAKAAYKTDWRIECVPECKDVNGNIIAGTVEAEEGSKAISVDAKRLEPSTHYDEVRLVVHNSLETIEIPATPAPFFDTPKSPPTVSQTLGAADGEGGYTLQGVVNPNKETITSCKFKWGPDAPAYAFSIDCSPSSLEGSKPITVEAHLTGLNPDVDYHALLVVTYGAGSEAKGVDQKFKATLTAKQPCPANEQRRVENNSLALPECRAYEMVTPPGKAGFDATLFTFDGGDRVAYMSNAANLAKSGQSKSNFNQYVAARTDAGWETIPDLNGSSGSINDAPTYVNYDPNGPTFRAYSPDLLSSVWTLNMNEPDHKRFHLYRRSPDGLFARIGTMQGPNEVVLNLVLSADLSHILNVNSGASYANLSEWGPGVYEFVGTGMDQPRRTDLDNSGAPISTCPGLGGTNARNVFVSDDGSRIVNYVYGGCGGANPPANELRARVNGTTAVDVSASQCDRGAADPGGVCNGPVGNGGCAYSSGSGGEDGPGCRGLAFQAATPDGSRIFFTTKQQLLDADTDQTNDLYACDLPAGNPAPNAEKANHCAALIQVSGAKSSAAVESVSATSENGATALFIAKGVLADDEDALGEEPVAGDHNLYAWRTDASHPDGQTTFLGRLGSDDLKNGGFGAVPQSTPDGRYLVFTTATQLLETDTDNARDVYRFDVGAGELNRASTNLFGVAGNGDGLGAAIGAPTEHNPSATISDDGQKIVFTTTEALSPADGNAEPDVYLWTPSRVYLISTGSSGAAPRDGQSGSVLTPRVAIAPSGQDIYFESAQPLTPADPDSSTDVYDARIGGGFSFPQPPICTGEPCQPDPTPAPPKKAPLSAQSGPGNPPQPKPCPKGKVRNKKGKCVKKPKKHAGKKHHAEKASHKQGGGK